MATTVRIGGRGALFIGEDKVLRLHVKDEDSNPVDVTGWVGRFVVGVSDYAATALIDKAWTVSGTYNAVNNPQRLVVTLTDTEMTIAKGKHRYSWKRTDDGSETILARGDFVVEEATQK